MKVLLKYEEKEKTKTSRRLDRKFVSLAGFLLLSISLFAFVAPAGAQTVSSAEDQTFTVGDPATSISTITITDDAVTPTIKAKKDIRIRIPTTFNMTWDTSITTVTIGGGASGKMKATLKAYEDSDKTMVLDVDADFAAGDQITVSGAKFTNFSAPSAADNLELDVDDDQVGEAFDDKTITINAGTVPNISSLANQMFNVEDAATAISEITVVDATTPEINLTDDIRIRIPSGFNMTWDTSDATATVGGNASGKVSTSVTFEDSNQTLVINVTSNFANGDYITVSGLNFANFSATSSADNLELEIDNLGTVRDTDDKTITIIGRYGPSSAEDQTFTVGDPATSISTITITDDAVTPTIKAKKDIRIRIPTTFNMTWDTSITTVTIGGGASGKMKATLKAYEDSDKTMVLDVDADFAAGDQITVSGAKFTNFSAPSAADNLELDVDDDQVGEAFDDKTITIVAVSAAVSGTITPSATEGEIVSGGKTIVIDLTGDTWVAAGGTFDAQRQNIINGITSAQSETTGWNNEARDKQGVTGVVRTDDNTVTITLDAQSGYDITADETITVTVPASALVTSSDPVVATPTFDITVLLVSAAVSGSITPLAAKGEIVSGGKTIIIDLTNDTWVADDGTFAAQRQNIINGITSAQSEKTGWNNEVRDKQGVTGVVRTSDTKVTITLDAQPGYEISANETITVTIPASALVTSGSDIVATPTFDIMDSTCKFSYRRSITIDHTKVGTDDAGTLPATGFPVLVSITMGGAEHWLKWSGAHASGHVENEYGWDIIFRESDGRTQLYHEIENYDGTNGTLVAWVRIDSLSKGPSDTTIYMYYGNDCISSATEEPENVWDTNFKGVWHMKEEATGIVTDDLYIDSTSNPNDGDDRVSATGQTGKMDGGQDFDGTDDYVNFGSGASLNIRNEITMSAWVNLSSRPSKDKWFNLHAKGTYIYAMYIQGADTALTTLGAYFDLDTGVKGLWKLTSIDIDPADGWAHVAVTFDNTDFKFYVNGVLDHTENEPGTIDDSAGLDLVFADGESEWFGGSVDEIRVSSTDRDLDWIRTCYNNQVWPNKASTPDPLPDPNPGSGFITVGNEETPVATAVELISFTATGQDDSVRVSWETAQEIRNLGFNLYRSTELGGTYSKLNRRLIPGLISSVSGQQYTYTDMDVTRSVLYYYMLEDVDLSGTRTMHGPVCVDWDNDGIPDDYYEQKDDDTDTDTGEEEPEVSIPDTEFDELELDLSDWTPSSSSASWVKLASFKARQEDEGIALEWETSFEVDILGFHVYREVDGKFYRVTADLVPGSVFKVGAGRELPAGQSYGQSYVYWDGLSEGTGYELYWLDSVELNGGRASFGPIRPEIYGQPVPKRIKARFRSIGKHQVSRARALGNIRALREELSTKPAKTYKSQVNLVQVVPEKPSGPRLLPGEEQWALAAQPGVKIYIKEDGWYRVGEPELVAAGLSPGVDPRYLQLYADGEEQSMMVTGSDDGRFDEEDAIEFYGTGLDTPFTAAHVYWLVVGSRPGRRLDTPFTDIRLGLGKRMRIPRGLRGRGAPLSFPFSVELKERTFYFAALTNGERENFFGSVISTEPVDQLLTVAHPDPSSPEDALLEVVLQGGTVASHQIKILFNYVEVGEVVFSGQEQWRAEIEVPYNLLLEGDNIITLTAQGGSMDVSLVDYIRLTYWRTYTADEDALRFRAMGGEWISIGGFSSPEIQVRDITDPMRMLKVRGKVMTQDSGYAITIKVPSGGERSLMAFTEDKIKRPAGIAANLASSWHELSQGAEVIIIGHRDLFESVRFLKELREQQGWSVVLVDVEDLYDEFNFGAKSPWALKDFLAQAYAYWNPQPRFVVLVGDTSYDPRNYLGFGEFDLVPTKFVDTKYLKTASDDWFVDFNDDELPEMAVGRLPVESAEEAAAVVSKIISYEGASGLMNEALLVADINDFFNFEGASGEVGSLFPGNITVSEVFRGQSPTARSDLLDSLNQGQLLVNYIGHGSAKIWKGNLLTSLDAWNLTNSPYLPFLVSMTCLNGFFQDPYIESLAETFLKAERGGAVAVWSSSGLTDPEGQVVMNKELIKLLFNGQGLTIGEAIMRAKQVVTDADVRKTWILFGDPTLRLK